MSPLLVWAPILLWGSCLVWAALVSMLGLPTICLVLLCPLMLVCWRHCAVFKTVPLRNGQRHPEIGVYVGAWRRAGGIVLALYRVVRASGIVARCTARWALRSIVGAAWALPGRWVSGCGVAGPIVAWALSWASGDRFRGSTGDQPGDRPGISARMPIGLSAGWRVAEFATGGVSASARARASTVRAVGAPVRALVGSVQR